MLGMNDIRRDLYGNCREPQLEEKRKEAFEEYENSLKKLSGMLKGIGVNRIIYLHRLLMMKNKSQKQIICSVVSLLCVDALK